MQVTAQRLAIMRVVAEHPHATADELGDVVRSQLGAISRQAVYDSLGVLVDKNLIRRIQPAGSAARYENRVGDNHHHLICRSCRSMFDVDCAVGEVPCLDRRRQPRIRESTKPKSSTGAAARPVWLQPNQNTTQFSPNNPVRNPRRHHERQHQRQSAQCCRARTPQRGSSANQHWWPNQLNLNILHQGSPASEPDGRRLRLRRRVRHPRLRRAEGRPHCPHDRLQGVVAG